MNKEYEVILENNTNNLSFLYKENKISVNLKDDEYIISKKTLNFKQNKSKIEIGVFFKVYENITDFKDADTSLLNKENTNEN